MAVATARNFERYQFVLLSISGLQTELLLTKDAVERFALRAEINCLIREADLISAYGLSHVRLEDPRLGPLAK